MHTAILRDLEPDTTYFYEFGSAEHWSDEHSFRTSSSESTKPFQFVMYADQGPYQRALDVIRNVEGILDEIDLVLCVGDNSYSWGNGYTLSIADFKICKFEIVV